VAISYRRSIVTKSLSPAIFEIMGTKHIEVTTLTFQGHVTSSVTWPFDYQGQFPIGTPLSPSLSQAISEIMGIKHWGHDLDLSGTSFPIGGPLDPSLYL